MAELDRLARAMNEAQDNAETNTHDDAAWLAFHKALRAWQDARKEQG